MVERVQTTIAMAGAIQTTAHRANEIATVARQVNQVASQISLDLSRAIPRASSLSQFQGAQGRFRQLVGVVKCGVDAIGKLSGRLPSLVSLPLPQQMDALASAIVESVEEMCLNLAGLRAASGDPMNMDEIRSVLKVYINGSFEVAVSLYGELHEGAPHPLLWESLQKHLNNSMMRSWGGAFSQQELTQLIEEQITLRSRA